MTISVARLLLSSIIQFLAASQLPNANCLALMSIKTEFVMILIWLLLKFRMSESPIFLVMLKI
ncbi:hypothetical protein CSQ93_24900 [Janthinobacterium sp. BJB426]|nr:hypothetical protein CSQ93_24900 [Janthinobacterium sp. BJB426]